MTQKIKFFSEHEFLDMPSPARKHIPEWYKKAEKYTGGKPHINHPQDIGRSTIKACTPFLESYTNGYIIELWQDIEVIYLQGAPLINWNTKPDVIEARDLSSLQGFPIGEESANYSFAWKSPFMIKTPKNYSILVSHPFNRLDLPFTTLTGIVDSDTTVTGGNIPFMLKKGFEGIIPKGTPIAQIIPFKRNSWESEKDSSLLKESKRLTSIYRSSVSGVYKKIAWHKKEYN